MDALERIGWVDEYVRNVRPYIHVREHDNVLIKIPNAAYRLNPAAVKMLREMMEGASAREIAKRQRDPEAAGRDIHDFFCDLRALLRGCWHEGEERRAVETKTFTLPHNTLPVLSEVAITYRCNLACRFCYAGCGCRRDDATKELSTGDLRRVLDLIRRAADVPSVSFTGGEPCLRADLPDLVAHAKSLGMWVNLITNGTLLSAELCARLSKAGLDSSQVSIEAGNADLHDAIVRHAGAFDRAVEGIGNLRSAGIRVHTNTTISGLNRAALPGLLELVTRLGLDRLSMNLLMPCGSSIEGLDAMIVRYDEIGPIVLGLRDAAARRGIEFMWYSPTPVCVFNPVVHGLGNKGCAACDGLLSIAPNGDVLPCSSFAAPVGNLLDWGEEFRARWEEENVMHYRRKEFAHEKCRACEDLAVCNGGCPLYWEKVGYGELEATGWA